MTPSTGCEIGPGFLGFSFAAHLELLQNRPDGPLPSLNILLKHF
jgi:hypothetical protein